MGMINHNVVIATGWQESDFEEITTWINQLKEKDQKLFTVSQKQINGYFTIYCGPDGSKEGWDDSNRGDDIREKFIFKLNKGYWSWIEVGYGEFGQTILQGNNENKY
jgi:hypothetical protein